MLFLLPPPAALIVCAEAPTRIPLKHLTAGQMILELRFPNGAEKPGFGPEIPGLESLSADGKTLIVSGSAAATTEIGRLAQLLDVAPRQIRLRLRVLQIIEHQGKHQLKTLTDGSITTRSDHPFQLRTEDNDQTWAISGSAHLTRDGSVLTNIVVERQSVQSSFHGTDTVDTSQQRLTTFCIGAARKPTIAAFLKSNGLVLEPRRPMPVNLKTIPNGAYLLEVTGSAERSSR